MKNFWLLTVFLYINSVEANISVINNTDRPYAIPGKEVKQFSLSKSSHINMQNLIEKMFKELNFNTASNIKITWAKPNTLQQATKIRNTLVSRGIAPYRITVNHGQNRDTSLEKRGITILIETAKIHRQHCYYNNHDYRYQKNKKLGCAMKSNLQRSLLDPTNTIFQGWN